MKDKNFFNIIDCIIIPIITPIMAFISLIYGFLILLEKVKITRISGGISFWLISLALFTMYQSDNMNLKI